MWRCSEARKEQVGCNENKDMGMMCIGYKYMHGSTHVTLGDFHILNVPTFDHKVPGI